MPIRISRRDAILGGGAAVAARPLLAAETQPLPIRIGYQAVASWLLLGARELGLYREAGLEATFLKFTAGPPQIAAAQGGSIDVAMVGSVPFLAGVSQGVDWVMVGLDNEYPKADGFVARADSGVNSLTDLKGKRIAFFRGSTAQFAVLRTLERLHIAAEEVTLLHLEPSQQLAAMLHSDIDVAEVWEPWMQKMVNQAGARIIETEAALGIYTGIGGYCVKRDWLAAQRVTVRRFINALAAAYDKLKSDPSPALKAVAADMGISMEEARAIYDEEPLPEIYRQADPSYPYSLAAASPFSRDMVGLVQFLLDQHVIQKPVEIPNVLDDSLIAEMVKAKKT
jgi:aliphatic sulfonates family ABC transporter substrate-binding protein